MVTLCEGRGGEQFCEDCKEGEKRNKILIGCASSCE